MLTRWVLLVCLSLVVMRPAGAASADKAIKVTNLAGQWELTLRFGRQELHGFMKLQQDGNHVEGHGRDHADFELTGDLDTSKSPPRVVLKRKYLKDQSGGIATWSGEVKLLKDMPAITGTFEVQPKQGRSSAGSEATRGSWEAIMLEALRPGESPTYLTPGDFIFNGDSYVERRDFRNAIRNFDKAIELNPKDALPYKSRGKAYNELKQYQKAIDDLSSALDLDPHDSNTLYERGVARRSLGKTQEALLDFTAAIDVHPQYARAYFERGSCQLRLGQYDKAIDDYGKAVSLDPNYSNAYFWRARAFTKLNKLQPAVEDLTKAISLDAENALAYRDRARAYSELGEHDKAIEDYTEAIRLNPKDQLSYAGRGVSYAHRAITYVKRGQEHKALADDAKAVEDYARAMPQSTGALIPAMLSGAGIVVAILIAIAVFRKIRGGRKPKHQ